MFGGISLSRIVILLLLLASWIVLLSFFDSANGQPVHPWRGYVKACVIAANERSCAVLHTKETFATEASCRLKTREIMDRNAKHVLTEHPDVFIEARIGCFEDQNIYNVGA